MSKLMKKVEHNEIKEWRLAHGEPLQIGLIVKTTEKYQWNEFVGGEFMVTSLSFDESGLNIGINDDGNPNDFSTGYDCFRVDELQPVKTNA